MKILEVAGSGTLCSEHMGPVSTDIFYLSRCFSELGHDVTIVDTKNNINRKIPEKIKFEVIDTLPRTMMCKNEFFLKSRITTWKNEIQFNKKLKNKISLETYDILHFHEVIPTLLYLMGKKDAKVVYTSHTPSWLNPFNKGIKKKFTYKIREFKEKWVIKNSDLTIALGNNVKKEILESNITVIPNGINIENFKVIDKYYARSELGINKEKFIIIFIGRITPIKGVDILLKSINNLKDHISNFKVYFIGPLSGKFQDRKNITPYAKKMLNMSKEKYSEFTGFISNKSRKFQLLLNSADVLILPSRFEPQGKVILEGMCVGKPIIASNTGGVSEMLNDGINGYLVKSGDYVDLSKKILKLYKNKKGIKKMGENSRRIVEDEFSWRKRAKLHISEFEYLLKSN